MISPDEDGSLGHYLEGHVEGVTDIALMTTQIVMGHTPDGSNRPDRLDSSGCGAVIDMIMSLGCRGLERSVVERALKARVDFPATWSDAARLESLEAVEDGSGEGLPDGPEKEDAPYPEKRMRTVSVELGTQFEMGKQLDALTEQADAQHEGSLKKVAPTAGAEAGGVVIPLASISGTHTPLAPSSPAGRGGATDETTRRMWVLPQVQGCEPLPKVAKRAEDEDQ